ncbi:hypothetical protein APHAL10511_002801 [Amanita phalloides]|nr:hypothetical protein APHAL10511_002801 [Amanita phalloides]
MKIAPSLDLDEVNASMLASAELDDPESRPALRKYSLQLFDRVTALIPWFEDILRKFLHDAPQLLALFSFMTRKARNQCSSDTGELKEKIVLYFTQPPPRTMDGTSPLHGFNCTTHVRLLCPRRHLEIFDRDPIDYGPTPQCDQTRQAGKNELNTGALNEIQLIREWCHLRRLAHENGEQCENGVSQSNAHGGDADGAGNNNDANPSDEENTAASGNKSTGRTSPTANGGEADDHPDDDSETGNGNSQWGRCTKSKYKQPASGTSEKPSKRQRTQRV